MDQFTQNYLKKQLVQKVASDLASNDPALMKRAEAVKSQFQQDKQSRLLTGEDLDFSKYLASYSNGPKSFTQELSKPFANAMAPAV